jgi:hypothetical protein
VERLQLQVPLQLLAQMQQVLLQQVLLGEKELQHLLFEFFRRFRFP